MSKDQRIFDFGKTVVKQSLSLATTHELIIELLNRNCKILTTVAVGDKFNIQIEKEDGEVRGTFADDIQKQISETRDILLIKKGELL